MNKTSVSEVIDAAPFNRTHLLILLWGCFIMLFDGYDMVIYGSVVPQLMQDWQLSAIEAGTLGSCALFGMLFGGTLIAPLADRFGRRKLIILTTLLASLAAFLTGHATTPFELGACRLVTGLALGALVPSAINLISEFAPEGRRSTRSSWARTSSCCACSRSSTSSRRSRLSPSRSLVRSARSPKSPGQTQCDTRQTLHSCGWR